MKTYLDLLPENKRNELRNSNLVRRIVWQEAGLAFPVILLTVYLISMNLALGIQLEAEDKISSRENSTPSQIEIAGYESRFDKVNRTVGLNNRVSAKHINWNSVTQKLIELVPERVYLKSLETRDYRIAILGWARERQDFLDFQRALGDSDCFKNIVDPLSNLVSRKNLDFTLEFEVKRECLLRYE